jgi:hypothetical protein
MAKRPYSPSVRIPATIITPSADINEEATTPQKRLNPPLAEVLANLIASLTANPAANRFLGV